MGFNLKNKIEVVE